MAQIFQTCGKSTFSARVLLWMFGPLERQEVHLANPSKAGGYLELERVRVRWFLSIDRHDLPKENQAAGKWAFRSITVDGEEIEFSDGFNDLHTQVYREILAGNGFGIEETRPSINLAYQIRTTQPIGVHGEYSHPMLHGLPPR